MKGRAPPIRGAQPAHQRRVLVVDDDPTCREIVGNALTEAGYSVRAARHGGSALVVLRIWRPDLIVMDLMMPIMDGFAFRRAQLANPGIADISTLVLSATPISAAEAVNFTRAAVLAKPFKLKVLFEAVEQLTRPSAAS